MLIQKIPHRLGRTTDADFIVSTLRYHYLAMSAHRFALGTGQRYAIKINNSKFVLTLIDAKIRIDFGPPKFFRKGLVVF